MNTAQIREVADGVPDVCIYELLYNEDIEVIEDQRLLKRKCDSAILASDGSVGIFIKPDLPEEYRQFLLWHEYGHYKLHYDENMHFNFYLSRFAWKTEREANTFAALNLLKGEDIYDQNVIALLISKGVPEQIAIKVYDSLI